MLHQDNDDIEQPSRTASFSLQNQRLFEHYNRVSFIKDSPLKSSSAVNNHIDITLIRKSNDDDDDVENCKENIHPLEKKSMSKIFNNLVETNDTVLLRKLSQVSQLSLRRQQQRYRKREDNFDDEYHQDDDDKEVYTKIPAQRKTIKLKKKNVYPPPSTGIAINSNINNNSYYCLPQNVVAHMKDSSRRSYDDITRNTYHSHSHKSETTAAAATRNMKSLLPPRDRFKSEKGGEKEDNRLFLLNCFQQSFGFLFKRRRKYNKTEV